MFSFMRLGPSKSTVIRMSLARPAFSPTASRAPQATPARSPSMAAASPCDAAATIKTNTYGPGKGGDVTLNVAGTLAITGAPESVS